ncbi:MAG: YqaJ viral recombinase family protein [Lachnobacterium sp.]|nr:YqaJ viral recombinase family protein [Lachnobacterium sp.]
MKVVVKTSNLTREEWLKYRTKGIGGSDVSIIAGINPFKSVHQLWLEKTGQAEPEEEGSEYTHFGTLLEPIVRKEFMERTGIKVRQKHMLLQSEEHPFMFADLDGVINEDGQLCIFEAKTASAYKQEVWEEEVPAPYILQIQHYMAVTGAKKTYIAALVGGNHFFYHVVERDEEMIAKIIVMEKYFWQHHVMGGVEPVPDGSEATTRYFNERFRNSNGETIELPDEVLQVCEEYDNLTRQIRELETAKNAAANQLKSYLGEAEAGTVGDRKITWKSVSKNSVDTKRLKSEHPDIYTDCLTQSSYRRFLVA